MKRILLIEDDAQVRARAARTLGQLGHQVVAVEAADATDLLSSGRFHAVIVSTPAPRGPVGGRIPKVIELPAPMAAADLRAVVSDLTGDGEGPPPPPLIEVPRIVGESPAMRRLRGQLAAVADADAPVVLTGETGTGKELLARAIHATSGRRAGAFLALNCAAIPDALFESELFGHERGAFTGAVARRDGKLRVAHGGTLLLDEVDALSPAAQAKLLRVLQDGVVQPVGSDVEHAVDVRLICATNRPLRDAVTAGQFREDLFYRIQVLDLDVPPLRERRGDLRALVEHFLAAYARPGASVELSPGSWAALAQHRFPGNVRELEHVCQRALVMARGQRIEVQHLPPELRLVAASGSTPSEVRPLVQALHAFERGYLERALHAAGGNKTRAAKLLGISRKNLWERLGRTAATAEEVQMPRTTRTNSEPPPPPPRRRILLVEDDRDLREALSDALTACDVDVVAVDDGREGLRRMHDLAPDAVVLDLMMPGMDGWQFRLEQRRDPMIAATPVIAISASHSATAQAVDADRFLQKPCTAVEILEAVDDVMASRHVRAAPLRVAQADRMQALGTLAAGVAHEINNPLTYILIHLTHALRMLPTITAGAERRDARHLEALVSGALEGAERIRDITRRIRTFARSDDEVREPLDPSEPLASALALIGNEFRHKAQLVRESEPMPWVLGDEGRLAQVFLNLLGNALQAIPDGDPAEHQIRVTTGTDDVGRAVIEIADTGTGIAPEHLPRVFEPFFTTKPIGEGTGLGLWISHGIVKAMGGEIQVTTEVGHGSTFRVVLPAHHPVIEEARRG